MIKKYIFRMILDHIIERIQETEEYINQMEVMHDMNLKCNMTTEANNISKSLSYWEEHLGVLKHCKIIFDIF